MLLQLTLLQLSVGVRGRGGATLLAELLHPKPALKKLGAKDRFQPRPSLPLLMPSPPSPTTTLLLMPLLLRPPGRPPVLTWAPPPPPPLLLPLPLPRGKRAFVCLLRAFRPSLLPKLPPLVLILLLQKLSALLVVFNR